MSGVSFREEMFSTSEIDVVETTIALTSSSTSQAAINEAPKIHGKMKMISKCIMRISSQKYTLVNLKKQFDIYIIILFKRKIPQAEVLKALLS